MPDEPKKLVIRPIKPGEPRLTNDEAQAFLGMLARRLKERVESGELRLKENEEPSETITE